MRVIPSQANYFLCEVLPPYTSKQLTHVLLNDEILVKDCSSKIAFNGKNYVRIAVRDRNDNDKIVKILKELSVS